MAIAVVGTLGTGISNSTTATTSLALTTATNTLSAGQIGILSVVSRNTTTTTGATNNHGPLPTGGTGYWWKLGEHTYSPGGVALDGLTESTWLFIATATLAIGTIITIPMTSVAEKSATFHKFTVGANAVLYIYTGPQYNQQAAANGFGSVNFAALPSTSRLYYRTLGKAAGTSTTNITPSASFTAVTNARSRNNAAAVSVYGEFRINTSTGETSNPTLAVSAISLGSFIAFEEITKVAASSFTDNFDDNILTGWTDGDEAGATLTEAGQQLRLQPPAAGTTGISQAIAATRYDMTGDAFYVCLVQAGVAGNDLVISRLKLLSDNGEYNFPIVSDNGSINYFAERYVNTVGTDPFGPAAYTATTQQWLRILHDVATDTIKWQTAPKGKNPPASGDWVTRYSEARVLNVQSVRPYLQGWNAEGIVGGGQVIFDGFNTSANTLGTDAVIVITDDADSISASVSFVTTIDSAFTDATDTISATVAITTDIDVAFTDDADTISADATVTTDVGTATADVVFTDEADTISATAAIATNIDVVFTDATDTIAADASLTNNAAVVIDDGNDAISATIAITTNSDIVISDDADTISATVSITTNVAVVFSDADDTIASDASIATNVNVAFTDATDTITSDASLTNNAAIAFDDGNDAISASVSFTTAIDVAFTDATDTITSDVSISTNAAVAFTDADDTIAATVSISTNASIVFDDGNDAISSTITFTTAIDASFTDETDTIAATVSSAVETTANVAFTDADDTIAATAALTTNVAVAFTDADDAIASTASFTTTIDASFTDATDTIAATASFTTAIAVAFTDADDTIAATAALATGVVVIIADSNDTIAATASVTTNAVITIVDADDTIAATVAVITNAAIVFSDATDTISATAGETVAVVANVAFTDADDTIQADATVTGGEAPVIPVHGGSAGPRPYRSQFTRTYLAGDAHVTRYARLKVILDGVTCKAYAQVGRNERARTKRRAAIAMLIG